MAIRIRESIAKIWSSQNQRQYGIDNPLRVDLSSPAEETFLAMLELGIANGQMETAAKLAGLGLDSAELLIEKLSDVLDDYAPNIAKPELHSLRGPLLESFWRRQRTVVYIPKIDRLGRLLIHSLANSGVGKIIVGDSTMISEQDCGRLGFQKDQIGNSRLSILKSEIANAPCGLKLDNRMGGDDYSQVDIAMVIADGAFQPADYQLWSSLKTRHVGICFSDTQVLITGVVSQKSACLGCRELHIWDRDPARRMICGQIAGMPNLRDSNSILFAASLASQRILKEIDFGTNLPDVSFSIDSEIESFSPGINPACNCQLLPAEISKARQFASSKK